MNSRRRWLLGLAALAAGSAWGKAEDGETWGAPLRFPNAHPMHAVFLDTPALDGSLPVRPKWDFRWSHFNTMTTTPNIYRTPAGLALLANTAGGRPQEPLNTVVLGASAKLFPSETFIFADTETSRLDIDYTQPFGQRWGVEVEVPLMGHLGGVFDPVIEGFHQTFNFPTLGRGDAPLNQTQLVVAHGSQMRVYDGPFEPGLGDIVIRGLHAPVRERWDRPAVMLSTSLKLPTGAASRFYGSGGWDFGFGLHLAKSFGDFRLAGTLGHDWHDAWRGLESVPVSNTFDLHVAAAYRASHHWSTQARFTWQQHALREAAPGTFGKASMLLGVGFRYQASRDLGVEGGFFENLTEDRNGYDAGLQCAFRWQPWDY